jgi:hypothetical protein
LAKRWRSNILLSTLNNRGVLSDRAYWALDAAEIRTLGDVRKLDYQAILSIRGIGNTLAEHIAEVADAQDDTSKAVQESPSQYSKDNTKTAANKPPIGRNTGVRLRQIRSVLRRAGISDYTELDTWTDAEIQKLPNIGPALIAEIRMMIAAKESAEKLPRQTPKEFQNTVQSRINRFSPFRQPAKGSGGGKRIRMKHAADEVSDPGPNKSSRKIILRAITGFSELQEFAIENHPSNTAETYNRNKESLFDSLPVRWKDKSGKAVKLKDAEIAAINRCITCAAFISAWYHLEEKYEDRTKNSDTCIELVELLTLNLHETILNIDTVEGKWRSILSQKDRAPINEAERLGINYLVAVVGIILLLIFAIAVAEFL